MTTPSRTATTTTASPFTAGDWHPTTVSTGSSRVPGTEGTDAPSTTQTAPRSVLTSGGDSFMGGPGLSKALQKAGDNPVGRVLQSPVHLFSGPLMVAGTLFSIMSTHTPDADDPPSGGCTWLPVCGDKRDGGIKDTDRLIEANNVATIDLDVAAVFEWHPTDYQLTTLGEMPDTLTALTTLATAVEDFYSQWRTLLLTDSGEGTLATALREKHVLLVESTSEGVATALSPLPGAVSDLSTAGNKALRALIGANITSRTAIAHSSRGMLSTVSGGLIGNSSVSGLEDGTQDVTAAQTEVAEIVTRIAGLDPGEVVDVSTADDTTAAPRNSGPKDNEDQGTEKKKNADDKGEDKAQDKSNTPSSPSPNNSGGTPSYTPRTTTPSPSYTPRTDDTPTATTKTDDTTTTTAPTVTVPDNTTVTDKTGQDDKTDKTDEDKTDKANEDKTDTQVPDTTQSPTTTAIPVSNTTDVADTLSQAQTLANQTLADAQTQASKLMEDVTKQGEQLLSSLTQQTPQSDQPSTQDLVDALRNSIPAIPDDTADTDKANVDTATVPDHSGGDKGSGDNTPTAPVNDHTSTPAPAAPDNTTGDPQRTPAVANHVDIPDTSNGGDDRDGAPADGSADPDQGEKGPVKHTVTFGNKDIDFPDAKTAAMADALNKGTGDTSLRDLAKDAGITVGDPGEDIGRPIDPSELRPGDIITNGDGRDYIYLGDDQVVGADKQIKPLTDVADFSSDNAGCFRMDTGSDADAGADIGGGTDSKEDGTDSKEDGTDSKEDGTDSKEDGAGLPVGGPSTGPGTGDTPIGLGGDGQRTDGQRTDGQRTDGQRTDGGRTDGGGTGLGDTGTTSDLSGTGADGTSGDGTPGDGTQSGTPGVPDEGEESGSGSTGTGSTGAPTLTGTAGLDPSTVSAG